MVNKITEIWKSERELQDDIELVRKPFVMWKSQKQNNENDIEIHPEDAAFEALCELYGVELASKKLDIIFESCFDKPTYEGGGWVKG